MGGNSGLHIHKHLKTKAHKPHYNYHDEQNRAKILDLFLKADKVNITQLKRRGLEAQALYTYYTRKKPDNMRLIEFIKKDIAHLL